MPEFIYNFSSLYLFIFLNAVLILFSFLAVTLVRRHVPINFRYEENTALVCCSALLGIIYAILIGFTILYQMNAFDRTAKAENAEGKILYNIYRNASFLPSSTANQVRTMTLDYAQNAIHNEWPALSVGSKVDDNGKKIIENIAQVLHSIPPTLRTPSIQSASNTIAQDLNGLFEVRHERVAHVHTTLNGHMWFVILLSSLITLGINFFLGMEYRLHLFCITLICVIMATIIYLIVGLDRPYQGDFVVHPESISSILELSEANGTNWADNYLSEPLRPIASLL